MSSTNTLTDTDHGYAELIDALSDIAEDEMHVVVGIRSAAGGEDVGGGFNLAALATVHEFGSSDGHVPERSFLRSTVDANRGEIADKLEDAIEKLLDNGTAAYETALGRLGVWAAGKVQQAIADRTIGGPPNAPSTIERKGSSVPIVDTGRLRQSIDSEVRQG